MTLRRLPRGRLIFLLWQQIAEVEAVVSEDGLAFGEGDGAGEDRPGVYERMKLAVFAAGIHVGWQRIEKVLVELSADEAAIK